MRGNADALSADRYCRLVTNADRIAARRQLLRAMVKLAWAQRLAAVAAGIQVPPGAWIARAPKGVQ